MKHEQRMVSNHSTSLTGFMRFCTLCFLSCWISLNATPVIAQEIEIFDPTKYFGDPDQFIENFELGIKENINEYMGTALAITGFILVIRTFT